MFELRGDEYTKVLPMFSTIQNKAVFALSVLEQRQKGNLYVNDKINPTAAFLTSCGGFYCLAGTASDTEFVDQAVEYLNNKNNHIGFYALAIFSEDWETALQRYQLVNANEVRRTHFMFIEVKFLAKYKDMLVALDEEFHYEGLSEEISNIYREDFYTYYKLVWESNQHFRDKGVGHFITKENKIISVCSSPYVGGDFAEIDIITVEEYKRKGLATQVGIQFIHECLARGLKPNWSCHSDNPESLNLADKLGFEQIAEHSMYWYND